MDSEALQLKSIELRSRPFGKRAISWSADAELAVAADDSVWVLVPQFPRFNVNFTDPVHRQAAADGSSSWVEGMSKGLPLKPQYADGQRRIPISLPRVSPRVNYHLFAASAVTETPYDGWEDLSDDGQDGDGSGNDVDDQDDHDNDHDHETPDNDHDHGHDQPRGATWKPARNPKNRQNPFAVTGAGSGLFTGVGSSLNHVVSLAWSPPMGRNGRCVLAVHSAGGYVAVYGEPLVDPSEQHQQQGHHRLGSMYSTESWEVLWGVGERLVVPGQTSWGECYRAFAWSRELWPGKALMALQTDDMEVVLLAVQARCGPAADDAHVAAGWRVEEVARFEAKGPHPPSHVHDLDYVPDKSTAGLSFAPCARNRVNDSDEELELALGYVAPGYVGFRKITVKREWFKPGDDDEGFVHVSDADIDGMCMFLSTDAFIVFEDQLWSVDGQNICRGIIASPFVPKQFQVNMSIDTATITPHDRSRCNCLYPSPGETLNNPIQDLVIHPPPPGGDMTQPPIYTLVRLSATQTTSNWYESSEADGRPQWATAISRLLEISMPRHMLGKTGAEGLGIGQGDDEEDDEYNDNDDDNDMDNEDEDDNDEDEDDTYQDADGEVDVDAAPAPADSVHIWRGRLYGVALSPGGGCSAVVWARLPAAVVERGAWHQARSTLSFDCQRLRRRRQPGGPRYDDDDDDENLSTEARMFEFMYGRGPAVAGVTVPGPYDGGLPDVRQACGAVVASAACAYCMEPLVQDGLYYVCPKKHYFETCTISGLPILKHGTSRVCGVCGHRSLKAHVIADALAGEHGGLWETLRSIARCVRCGGKFVD